MSKYFGICLVVSLVLSTGCGKKFVDIFSSASSRLSVNEIKFEYLSAKAKVDFSGEKDLSGSANFRIAKDSIIWISLSPGLGIEAARILVSQDSIFLLDKINHELIALDFISLSQQFDFAINYHLIESVILGNLIFPYQKEKVMRIDNLYAYNQKAGSFYFDNYIGPRSRKLEKLIVKDTLSQNSISVSYGDFQLVEDEILPFKLAATLKYQDKSKKTTTVEVEYNKVEIEKKPLKFPFNVPQRYDRK